VSVAERLAGLEDIGAGPGGVTRLAWSAEDAACREWFAGQAAECALSVETDPAGNLWACPSVAPPWWAIGSHLDSVRDGGRFDGPLGVAAGFEVAARSKRPIAVISFADEEGARFNTPTFGSKALAGRLDLPAVLARRDPDGVSIAEAMSEFGVDPDGIAGARSWLEKLSGFLEVHIDQTTELARAGAPAGVVSSLANRMRIEVDIEGRADHAGTTPRAERRDALLGAARLVVASDQIAEELGALTVTASRILVEPNASTTIASRVRLWIDARSADQARIDAWLQRLGEVEAGVKFNYEVASRSAGREFAPALRGALREAARDVLGSNVPEVVCFAGHDAGVVAEHVPAAMLFVRNPSGISHAAQEDIDLDDAEVAVQVVRQALERLA
jgi:beta-ureidopropionase / N-carbamoyl-L-amino-acid hydrolase